MSNQVTNDILAMWSPEGEKVSLTKGLKARGNVEDWLGKVEESMFTSLRRLVKFAIADFDTKPREEWVLCHASQVSFGGFIVHTRWVEMAKNRRAQYGAIRLSVCLNRSLIRWLFAACFARAPCWALLHSVRLFAHWLPGKSLKASISYNFNP